MPTDNKETISRKVLIKSITDEIIRELQCYEFKAEPSDDKVDAIRYYTARATGNWYNGELTLSKEASRRLLKVMGENRITRKRFIKLLMGYGIQRNKAQDIAKFAHIHGWKYTPNLVKTIVAMIIWKGDNEQNVGKKY